MTHLITVRGNVATEPNSRTLPNSDVQVVEFRLAATERRYDRHTNSWSDGNTNWFTVAAYRSLAKNVKRSIFKGQPVTVTGKLSVRTWTAKDKDGEQGGTKTGTTVQIEAESLGHDLTLGFAEFHRPSRPAPEPETVPDTETAPDPETAPAAELGKSGPLVDHQPDDDAVGEQSDPESFSTRHDDDESAGIYSHVHDKDLVTAR